MMDWKMGWRMRSEFKLSNNVTSKAGRHYFVDTADTLDHGLETMIFETNENFEVISWHEVYAEWHQDYVGAAKRHEEICNNIDEYV